MQKGQIRVQTENIFPIIKKFLYSEHEIFLRELVSNAISHAQARRVQVRLRLQDGTLRLTVSDDGIGTAPEAWSHGLGLGGVRKRAKQLGGSVRWSAHEPHGICCEVEIPHFAGACPEDQASH